MSIKLDTGGLATQPKPRHFLHQLNSLAIMIAPVPVVVLLFVLRDWQAPLAIALATLIVLLLGSRMQLSRRLILLGALPVILALLTVTFSMWNDPETVADTPILLQLGPLDYHVGALIYGFGSALRVVAILLLILTTAIGLDGSALVRALVAHLRVPYRFAYTGLAAFRFVPRFRHELELIRQAHRVRGSAFGRGPIARVRRGFGYVVPLLAGAIRHAERVSLAMDSRAFGAYETRTERYESRFGLADWAYMLGVWAFATAATLVFAFS